MEKLHDCECEYITQAPIPGSQKVYIASEVDPRVRVPMRRIDLADTVAQDGGKTPNAPIYVYDTSGPFTDPSVDVEVQRGIPRLRAEWIAERGDTEELAGLSSEYGRQRLADKTLDHLRFPHVCSKPLRAKAVHGVTQIDYARKCVIRPEMEFVGVREK